MFTSSEWPEMLGIGELITHTKSEAELRAVLAISLGDAAKAMYLT